MKNRFSLAIVSVVVLMTASSCVYALLSSIAKENITMYLDVANDTEEPVVYLTNYHESGYSCEYMNIETIRDTIQPNEQKRVYTMPGDEDMVLRFDQVEDRQLPYWIEFRNLNDEVLSRHSMHSLEKIQNDPFFDSDNWDLQNTYESAVVNQKFLYFVLNISKAL